MLILTPGDFPDPEIEPKSRFFTTEPPRKSYSAVEENEVESFVGIRVDRESIIQSELSQNEDILFAGTFD